MPGGFPGALPKENQLEAEPFTPRPRHITRVIPPFRAKIFVFEVIAGKLVRIAGKSFAVREAAPESGEKIRRKQDRNRPTIAAS